MHTLTCGLVLPLLCIIRMSVKRTRKPLRSCASGGYRSSSIGGSIQCVPHVITFDLCVFFGYEREGAKLSKKARNPLTKKIK